MRVALGGQEESSRGTPEPTYNAEFVEPSTTVEEVRTMMEEVRVLAVPTRQGTSKAVKAVSAKLFDYFHVYKFWHKNNKIRKCTDHK